MVKMSKDAAHNINNLYIHFHIYHIYTHLGKRYFESLFYFPRLYTKIQFKISVIIIIYIQ